MGADRSLLILPTGKEIELAAEDYRDLEVRARRILKAKWRRNALTFIMAEVAEAIDQAMEERDHYRRSLEKIKAETQLGLARD